MGRVDDGPRPSSAGNGVRYASPSRVLLRQKSSLEYGIIGAPPPLIRPIGGFTVAEVEQMLAVREREIATVKSKLHRILKRRETAEFTVATLTDEASKLRSTADKKATERDVLQVRVAGLEGDVKFQADAAKTATRRQEKAAEKTAAEIIQAESIGRHLQGALTEAVRKSARVVERAEAAEARVSELEAKGKNARDRAAEAKRVAAAELEEQAKAHKKKKAMLKDELSKAAANKHILEVKLEEALQRLRQKREAEEETEGIIKKLQAWRERVLKGEIVEMSPAEVKRLQWSEEQGEILKEANASLRAQLAATGMLLAEAEHSFERVRQRVGGSAGTITDLSKRLEKKESELVETEKELRISKVKAARLKELSFGEAQRQVRGRERAMKATKRGMEAVVRARQEKVEDKKIEVARRSAAEKAAVQAWEEVELFQLRTEKAEVLSREMDVERRVLVQYLATARQEVASAQKEREGYSGLPSAGLPNGSCWKELTRSLLERAVSDWSIKKIFCQIAGKSGERKKKISKNEGKEGSESPLESSGSSSREEAFTPTPAKRKPVAVSEELGGIGHEAPRLEVVRVYQAPKEGLERVTGWRWDLAFKKGVESNCSKARDDLMNELGIATLGQSLREVGVRGEGAKTSLTTTARLFNALQLTRTLAAKQCAQARMELASAIARLSSCAAVVSETRMVSRQLSSCNRTLLLRLVDAELRSWCTSSLVQEQERATTSCVSQPLDTEDGAHPSCKPVDSDIDEKSLSGSICDLDEIETAERRAASPPKVKGSRRKAPSVSSSEVGLTLQLSNYGLDDETLHLVVRKLLRRCTQSQARPGTDKAALKKSKPTGYRQSPLTSPTTVGARGGRNKYNRADRKENNFSANGEGPIMAAVPLSRLLLRGNHVTDMGAFSLCPLVEASMTLIEIDLRDTSIGKRGQLALKKALTSNPWVHRVTSEDSWDGGQNDRRTAGLILLSQRRLPISSSDRARAYAFKIFPPSHKLGARATTDVDKLADFFPERVIDSSVGSHLSTDAEFETNANGEDSAPAHGEVFGYQRCASKATEQRPSASMDGMAHFPAPSARVTPGERRRGRCVDRDRGRKQRSERGLSYLLPGSAGARASFPKAAHFDKATKAPLGPAADQFFNKGFANLVDPTPAKRRRLRRPRERGTDLRGDCQYLARSEAEDLDELKSLLSASCKIFSEAEGLVSPWSECDRSSSSFNCTDTVSNGGVASTRCENNVVLSNQGKDVEAIATTSTYAGDKKSANETASGYDKRGVAPNLPTLRFGRTSGVPENENGPEVEKRGPGPVKKRFGQRAGSRAVMELRNVKDRVAPRHPVKKSRIETVHGTATFKAEQVNCCHDGGMLEESNGYDAMEPVGGCDATKSGQDPQFSTTGGRDVQSLGEAISSIEDKPAFTGSGNEMCPLGIEHDRKVAITEPENDMHDTNGGGENGGAVSDSADVVASTYYHSATDKQPQWAVERSEAYGMRRGSAEQNPSESIDLQRVAEGNKAAVETSSKYVPHPNQEWTYDEPSASWYVVACGVDKGNEGRGPDYNGWRYDEQSGTWYQGDFAWHESPDTDVGGQFDGFVPREVKELKQGNIDGKIAEENNKKAQLSVGAHVVEGDGNIPVAENQNPVRTRSSGRDSSHPRVGATSRAIIFLGSGGAPENTDFKGAFRSEISDGGGEPGELIADRIKTLELALQAKRK